jgi:hypothetical protein
VSGPWQEPQVARHHYELDGETLLRTLVEHDVQFVVVGGLAVAAHGYVRATKDVDVVPDPKGANPSRLDETLDRLGAHPLDLGTRTEGGNALRTSAGRIDVLQWLAGVEGFQQLRSGALSADVPGVGAVLFAGYDDLVAMKRAAGRPQDDADLAALEDVRRDSA